MNIRSSIFAAPPILAAGLLLVNCSSTDTPAGGNSGGTPAGGASTTAGAGGSKAGATSGGGGSNAGGQSTSGSSSGGAAAGSSGASGSGGAGAGTGGAGIAGSAGGPPATFATVKSIISLQCFGSGCHSETGNPLQLTMDGATLYPKLLAYTTTNCGKLVNTASPADSALVKVLKADCNGTPRMPFQMCPEDDDPRCVTAENVAAIQAWIARGAPQQ